MFLESSKNAFDGFVEHGCTAFNFLAVVILLFALIPPFLDTRRSRKTFFLSEKFFAFYTLGGGMMWINAVANIVANALDGKVLTLFLLFSAFLVLNTISVIMNTYMWKIKKQNMRLSKEKGMSEQQYWETYLQKPE